MKYFLLTLGCQMNISDGERVHTILQGLGYQKTENEEEANIIGIIACSVRQKAIDKVYSKIHKWNVLKNSKNLITFISGCILPTDKEKFLKLFDIVFPMSELEQLPEFIKSYGIVSPASLQQPKIGIPANENIFSFWKIKPEYQSNFEAYIPIQNGCDKFCTFCAVPYTRGREVSRPSSEILNEIEKLVLDGYKTITLLGQNVNSYGLDKIGKEINFNQLMMEIGELGIKLKKDFWVYFTSPHPRDMNTDLIDIIAKYPNLAKQIHLPMQSGDDRVLIRMNRKHSMDRYREIVQYLKAKIPEASLFTDIIVGFTGETDEQFQNTVNAAHEFKFNMAYIAKYSPRPGAASFRWENDVNPETKKNRFNELTDVLKLYSKLNNSNLIGKKIKVLVTSKDQKSGYLSSLTEGKIKVRFKSDDENLIGDFTELIIESASEFSLEGSLVKLTNVLVDQESVH